MSTTYPLDVEVRKHASISECEKYRYVLARWWGDGPYSGEPAVKRLRPMV